MYSQVFIENIRMICISAICYSTNSGSRHNIMETQWKTEQNSWKFAENLIKNRSKILKISIYNSILIIALKPVTSLQNIAWVPLFVYIEVSTPYFLYALCPTKRWSCRLTDHKVKETLLLPWCRCIFHCSWFPWQNRRFLDHHLLRSPTPCMTLLLSEYQGQRMQGGIWNSNSPIWEQFESAFIWKYHFSPPFNAPAHLITTKFQLLDLWLLFKRDFLTV